MALVQGSCKTNNTYDSTSRCSGGVDDNGVYKNYCPVGSPKNPSTNEKWRKCDKAHGDPQDQINAGMSC